MGTIRKINCVTVVTKFKALFTNQLITKQPKQEAFLQSIICSPETGFQTDACKMVLSINQVKAK